jgi:hypothetical protein
MARRLLTLKRFNQRGFSSNVILRVDHDVRPPIRRLDRKPAIYRYRVALKRSYSAVVTTGDRKRVMVPVPFDPDAVWGRKPDHRVSGTVNGMGVRASIERLGDGFGFVLGAAWRRDCGIEPGAAVDVLLMPEGPQRDDLADDVRAALDAEPAAGAFFDGLAQFYRRAFLRWIDATKRRPEERARRIAEMVDLLCQGRKERQ